jgi:hypothetical protein
LRRHGRENWNGILAEKSGIKSIASFDPSASCALRRRDSRLDPEEFSAAPFKTARSLCAVRRRIGELALDDARFEYSRENRSIALGSVWDRTGGVCKAESIHPVFEKGRVEFNPPSLSRFGGSAHSNIAIDFGFRGVGTTNSNSCASGNVSGAKRPLYSRRFRRCDRRRRSGGPSRRSRSGHSTSLKR